MLILHPTSLLNLCIRSSSLCVCVQSLGLSIYRIISSENRVYYFIIWMPFIIFSCLITLDRTSSTMSNSSGKSKHQNCLVSDFREKGFNFSLLSFMLAVGFSFKHIPFYSQFSGCFNNETMVNFVKCLFSIEMIM